MDRKADNVRPIREFVQVPPGFRKMLEELADLAVLILDELDGDVDLEPWLGEAPLNAGIPVDAEGDTSDDEPSLGSLDRMMDQTRWSQGGGWETDLELDNCDDEDGGDTEPNGDEIDGDDSAEDRTFIGNGLRFVPADAKAVRQARKRLGAILDRVGDRR